ncbi:hypothetical protein JTE90_006100 [Oedothorax gibbosus]|uniref:Uncharacterized protein n=1 Tax=Oedothorax gibbosus TaxID=931172 RepID=A0AAV6V3Y4_9ARAC|nr:hypothetical protein JTE90_006100 [Oedothorax gibbosus]
MNFGAAFRCFAEESFVRSKLFNIDSQAWKSSEGSILEHMYGFWSLINGIILGNCFFFVESKIVLGLSVCAIALYLCFFALEAFLFKTLLIHGPTIYPFVLSALTLLWLLVSTQVKGCCLLREEPDENEILRKQFHFKSLSRKMK